MESIDNYISYLKNVRRYSLRTQELYRSALEEYFDFRSWTDAEDGEEDLPTALSAPWLRHHEAYLIEKGLSPRTVHLRMSALSGFSGYLVREGLLPGNAAKAVRRPKMRRRLPEFYRLASMEEYFAATAHWAGEDELELLLGYGPSPTASKTAVDIYRHRLRRLTVSLLHGTGIRRAELIGLTVGSFDLSRGVLHVRGKGDKMREIPLIPSLSHEICLYLKAAESMTGRARTGEDPLLVTEKGRKLYPEYVDRTIKAELDGYGITGRKSPHVLRHTIATELLDDGADLNSIKEMLGHSSLAATQVYTHAGIEKLAKVYNNAHPRAKKGGKDD